MPQTDSPARGGLLESHRTENGAGVQPGRFVVGAGVGTTLGRLVDPLRILQVAAILGKGAGLVRALWLNRCPGAPVQRLVEQSNLTLISWHTNSGGFQVNTVEELPGAAAASADSLPMLDVLNPFVASDRRSETSDAATHHFEHAEQAAGRHPGIAPVGTGTDFESVW